MNAGRPAPQRDLPRRGLSYAVEHREGIRLLVAGEGMPRGAELRESPSGDPVLFGHFTPYDRWAEIDSFFEGHFMERTIKGAFKRTIKEQRGAMQVLFQHGRDPQIGMKPLGPIAVLREEDAGPYYEVSLLAADYVRDTLMPGLQAGLYGASYKFRVMREEIVEDPGRSEHNPEGIPERTIKEAQVFEFGPVTFPAFQEATAGVRSVTDDYFLDGLAAADPEFVRMAASGMDFPALIARRLGIRSSTTADGQGTTPEAERMDSEDVGTLGEMLALASAYIEDQDESDEAANVTKMQDVQGVLIDLLGVEATETEPVEPEDEGMASDEPSGTDREAPDAPAETKTSDGGKAPEQENGKQPTVNKAAPGTRPTPLLGPKKEPWRL